jgi:hypothetical protein
VILILLAAMLASSALASTASAEAGPFWHHRAVGEKGTGTKIEESAPELIKGEGKEATLTGNIGGTNVKITLLGYILETIIYNTPLRGQIKTRIIAKVVSFLEPVLKGCEAKIGTNNTFALKGHLMWKWNGEKKQLEEQPQREQTWDIGYTAVAPGQQNVEEVNLTKGGLTTVTLSGTGCGILVGTFALSGSDVSIPNRQLEEFSKTLSLRTLANPQTGEKNQIFLQHYWDGTQFQGAKLGLVLGTEPAALTSQTESEAATDEIAVFEK